MVSSSSLSSATVGYSSMGLAEDCGRGNQQLKLKALFGGYGGRVVGSVAVAIGVCLLLVLPIHGHHSHTSERLSLRNSASGSSLSSSYLPYVYSPSPSASSAFARLQPPSLTSLCNTTMFPQLCLTTLSSYPSSLPSATLQDLTAFIASAALIVLNQTFLLGVNLSRGSGEVGGTGEMAVLLDCLELLDGARDGLNRSIECLSHLDARAPASALKGQVMDVRVWLSSSYTEQDTCWEEFQDTEGPIKECMAKQGQPIAPLLTIALSFAQTLQQAGPSTSYSLQGTPAPAAS